jgi:hypothetical protein
MSQKYTHSMTACNSHALFPVIRSVWNMMVISLTIEEHAGSRLMFCDVHHETYVHKHNIIVIRRVSTFFWDTLYIRSKLEYTPAVWHNTTAENSSKLENIKWILYIYALIDIFSSTPFVIMNHCCITYILKRFVPGHKILMFSFLLIFSRTTLTVALLWILLVSVYPLSKLRTF